MPTVQIATNALSEGPAFVEMASTARIGQDICLSASPADGEGPPGGGVRCERFNGRSRRKAPVADRALDASIGRKVSLQGPPREGPESAPKPSFRCERGIDFTEAGGPAAHRGPPSLEIVTPCICHLPAGAKPARLRTQASPSPLRVSEPACELGAACVRLSECPNSRKGRSSPHLQGRVMDEPRRVTTCVGIDVSKDRLDVHVLPTGEAFAVARALSHRVGLRSGRGPNNRGYEENQLREVSVPTQGHTSGDLALSSVHTQLS